MATVNEIPKLSHCRFDNKLFQKVTDKLSFKRQARDSVPGIDYCVLRNVNTGEEMPFQWDVEVTVVHPDTLTTFGQVGIWKKCRHEGTTVSKVPPDDKFNAVSKDCNPKKIEEGTWVELLL